MLSSQLRATTLRAPASFLFVRGEGFDADEVDALLARCADALQAFEEGGVGEMNPDEIVVKQFRYARLGRTYDPDQIDDLLDEVGVALRAHREAAGLG